MTISQSLGSGTQYLARTVLRELTERFSTSPPTEAELREYLDGLPNEIAEDVSLLALVAIWLPERMYHVGFGALEETHPHVWSFSRAGSESFFAACDRSPRTTANR